MTSTPTMHRLGLEDLTPFLILPDLFGSWEGRLRECDN